MPAVWPCGSAQAAMPKHTATALPTAKARNARKAPSEGWVGTSKLRLGGGKLRLEPSEPNRLFLFTKVTALERRRFTTGGAPLKISPRRCPAQEQPRMPFGLRFVKRCAAQRAYNRPRLSVRSAATACWRWIFPPGQRTSMSAVVAEARPNTMTSSIWPRYRLPQPTLRI